MDQLQILVLYGDAAPPEEVEVVVEEDDRHLLLREQPLIFDVSEGYSTLTRKMSASSPHPPGTILVNQGTPLRLVAIVYDIDREPIWDEQWVAQVYDGIMTELNRWQASSVVMPLLGVQHGKMDCGQSLKLFKSALEERTPVLLEQLYLRLPEGCVLDELGLR